MKIVIIGLGYVGLPLAILLARKHKVIGVDINKQRVADLNSGTVFIDEDDVKAEFSKFRGNFTAKTAPEEADAFIIAVPTPVNPDKSPGLAYVDAGLKSILPLLKKGNLVILESTVPPLTTSKMEQSIEKATRLKVPEDVMLAHCPERVLPGNSFYELINNSRIVGGVDKRSTDAAAAIYSSFVKGEIVKTDSTTAEFCKCIENAYRDVNIAFANELSLMAKGLGINIKEAIAIANKHPRVNIHKPGIGVGGHCIGVDPWFLVDADKKNTTIIQLARKINDYMPEVTAKKIINAVKEIKNPEIVTIGLSYKPDVGDLRESPALEVVKLLKQRKFEVSDYDPLIDGKKYKSLAEAARGADCLVILVEHAVVLNELAAKEREIKSSMRTPVILRF